MINTCSSFFLSRTIHHVQLLSIIATLIILVSLLSTRSLYAETMPENTMRIALPSISIIIDDIGDSHRLGLRAAKLPKEVALSILPHTPFSRAIANFAHSRGMDIMLHQPMESKANVRLLGPGALLQKMDRQQFSRILEKNINAVPYVIGINNHMGSLLTQKSAPMSWTMQFLKDHDLFFLDSRTSKYSQAEYIAQQLARREL